MNSYTQRSLKLARKAIKALRRYSPEDIGEMLFEILSNQTPEEDKPLKAWEIVAWDKFINPHKNDGKMYLDIERIKPLIFRDGDALTLYATIVEPEPDPNIMKIMKGISRPAANSYKDYCDNYCSTTKR